MAFFRRKIPADPGNDANVARAADPSIAERRDADRAEIEASGLFDAAWYLEHNPDVAAAGLDPLDHYMGWGAAEARRFGPGFDVVWYLGERPDAGATGIDPLLHYLRIGRHEGCRRPVALDEGQAFDSFLAATQAGLLPFAQHLRAGIDHVHYALDPTVASMGHLPLPPLDLAVRIGSATLDDFETSGRGLKEAVTRCLPPGFDFRHSRCLDFGCGIGRVIRHFEAEARTAEFWGCDIDGTSIRWAVEALTPPFRFYQMAAAPTLPFEDSSFDLVYAIGVFSQLFDGWHQWAMELRRVLKPGGTLVMTYAGQTPFEDMLGRPYDGFDPKPGLFIKNPFNSWNRGGPMVFMSPAWVERYWGSLFDIDFVAPDALLDCLSLGVLRKPAPGSPPRLGAPILETATRQGFNPDATGKIFARYDRAKPFVESYGIEASGETEVEGWIALRSDIASGLSLSIDGVAHDSSTVWDPGIPFRDWSDTRQTSFRTRFDVGAVPPGRYRLTVRITGLCGTDHTMSIPLRVS